MKYDFTTIMNRQGQDAIAVDMPEAGMDEFGTVQRREGFDVIPMWVADMNFPVFPGVAKAMTDRIAKPHFGYFLPRDEYYDAIIRWQQERNGVTGLSRDCIGYENGVLGGVVSALNILASRGDNVLLHSPTYIGFTGALENNGYHIIHSPLRRDAEGIWRMDLEDMEQKIREKHIHAAIFCSPHNPTGRVWERQELEQMTALFEKYRVCVISDEIWSDILLDGHRHIPTQMVSDYARSHTMAFYAPTKTFSLAGLVGSYHIVYDPVLRDRLEKESSLSHYNMVNLLSMYALIGGYSAEGQVWVDELNQVLSRNAALAGQFFSEHFPEISFAQPQGTYMLFLDCEDYCRNRSCSLEDVLHKGWEVGVYWQDGRPFHGSYAIRVNLALPESRLAEAFRRLREVL